MSDLSVEHSTNGKALGPRSVTVQLEVHGRGSVAQLATDLDAVEGVGT